MTGATGPQSRNVPKIELQCNQNRKAAALQCLPVEASFATRPAATCGQMPASKAGPELMIAPLLIAAARITAIQQTAWQELDCHPRTRRLPKSCCTMMPSKIAITAPRVGMPHRLPSRRCNQHRHAGDRAAQGDARMNAIQAHKGRTTTSRTGPQRVHKCLFVFPCLTRLMAARDRNCTRWRTNVGPARLLYKIRLAAFWNPWKIRHRYVGICGPGGAMFLKPAGDEKKCSKPVFATRKPLPRRRYG